ncbi:hypothetical protein AB4Y89_05135 [Terriglobus sp. 2YAB30_2]|uniref:plasmid mobilization protein n=1 Tax=unclassified Terriglobus TaxID=2628988 RepID=UPI003F9C08EA
MPDITLVQKKAGRPKLAKREAKGEIVPVRFTPTDRRRIAEAAQASEMSVSEWTRKMLGEFSATEADWKKVIALFGKIKSGYEQAGDSRAARRCDDVIAFVRQIAVDSRRQRFRSKG